MSPRKMQVSPAQIINAPSREDLNVILTIFAILDIFLYVVFAICSNVLAKDVSAASRAFFAAAESVFPDTDIICAASSESANGEEKEFLSLQHIVFPHKQHLQKAYLLFQCIRAPMRRTPREYRALFPQKAGAKYEWLYLFLKQASARYSQPRKKARRANQCMPKEICVRERNAVHSIKKKMSAGAVSATDASCDSSLKTGACEPLNKRVFLSLLRETTARTEFFAMSLAKEPFL